MRTLFQSTSVSLALSAILTGVSIANDQYAVETVYTMSNNATQNQVLAFQVEGNRHMQAMGSYSTGGTGTGAGLGNQGPLALSNNHRFLFAVNPGSNDISVFKVRANGLHLVDRHAEPGKTPVSIAVSHNLVYVVNSGDDSIFGYQFNPATGKLQALPDSHSALGNTGTGAAQISFDKDGDTLVVTEKATNQITTFSLNHQGIPYNRHIINSAGSTPFGFAFGKRNQFFVSEAQGGAANQSSVSSYKLAEDGSVTIIDATIPSNETAACWLTTTPDGRIAFSSDTPANAISAFAIDHGGHLKLLNAAAATENKPNELAITSDGSTLFTLNLGTNSISAYNINNMGTLNKTGEISGLPAGTTGLVVTEFND